MEDFTDDDYQMALSKFESMLKSNKVYFFDSEEFEEIVYFYMDSGKMNLAKKAIALSLTQHPTSIPLKLIKVELLIFEKNFKAAEKLLITLENIDSTFEEIFIQKASILSKKDNHIDAIVELQKALELTNDFVDVHSLLGMEYLFLEKFDLARASFEICINEDIEDYAALYNIIYCFDMLDKNKEAINFLNSYIDKNPYSEIAWHQLGRQYCEIENYNEALRAFDYAILIDEQFIGAYLEKAKVLEEQAEFEEAISNYMVAIRLDDPTAFTYLQIAHCYEELGENNKAIQFYLKAIDEDPMLDKAWLLITSLYLDSDNPEKASYFIRKALEVDPQNFNFVNRLAEINIRLNLFEEAAVLFKKSIALGDDRISLFIALVDVLHFIGDFDEAENILLQAKKTYHSAPEIYYRLSGINFLLRKTNDALIYLEFALKADFEYHKVMMDLFPTLFKNIKVNTLIAKFNS